jgi:cytochrome c551/c552
MKNKLFVALFMACSLAAEARLPVEEGRALFQSRCASCHNVNKQLTGPALAGISERRSMDWLVGFITSSKRMISRGDQEAVALFEKFNRVPMPDHPDLTREHIASILEFIASESKEAGKEKAYRLPPDNRKMRKPFSIKEDWLFFGGYLVAVFLLVIVLLFGVRARELRQVGRQEN